jgi:hypothetical protein
MSGGSFGHLWAKDNARDLAHSFDTIRAMAAYLKTIGPDANAARALSLRVVALIEEAFEQAKPLLGPDGVWKAAEWHFGGDYGDEQLHQALLSYNRGDHG